MTTALPLPLRNVRVLSLALNLPGPAALMRCARMGAECTKLEPPPPPGYPSADPMGIYSPAAYATLHQGVRVVHAHLKTPEGQAALATSSCYWGMPANSKAALSEAQKKTLRWNEQTGFLAKSYPYPSPIDALDKAMQDMWLSVVQKK